MSFCVFCGVTAGILVGCFMSNALEQEQLLPFVVVARRTTPWSHINNSSLSACRVIGWLFSGFRSLSTVRRRRGGANECLPSQGC